MERIVAETAAAGAEVRAGGVRNGLFCDPTVLAGVTPAMAAFQVTSRAQAHGFPF